jgi:anti-sigma factor RsiW
VTASGELTCRELVELVTAYLDGALPAGERSRFEEHLVYCPGCAYYVEQMRETVRLTGRLAEEDVPGEARERLLAVFRDWKAGGP